MLSGTASSKTRSRKVTSINRISSIYSILQRRRSAESSSAGSSLQSLEEVRTVDELEQPAVATPVTCCGLRQLLRRKSRPKVSDGAAQPGGHASCDGSSISVPMLGVNSAPGAEGFSQHV